MVSGSVGVAGIGVDLLRVDRVHRVYQRYGEKFILRILGPQEQVVFYRRLERDPSRGIRYLATRFAAKEAFSKAIGLGMRMPMVWSRMQTLNASSGKPSVVLSGDLKTWYASRFGAAHITLTDEADLVMAFAVVESLHLIKE